jgi:hypothetical protein
MMPDITIEEAKRVLEAAGAAVFLPQNGELYSGLSWNGFILRGDRKSIEEARRLLHTADRAHYLQAELLAARGGR